MTAVSDANDNLKHQPLEQHTPHLFNSLTKSDWQAFTTKAATTSTGEPTSGHLSFDTDIYGQNLGKATASLSADEKALKSVPEDSSERTTDVAKLNRDEQTLRQDVFALKAAAPNFSDFSSPMQADKSELTKVADGLWQMGLKSQAKETTAYYPLSHYADQFANKGTGSASDGNSGSTSATAGTVSDGNSGNTSATAGTVSDGNSGSTSATAGTVSDGNSGSTNTSATNDGSAGPSPASGSDTGSAGSSASGLQNILTIPADTAPQLTNNTFGSGGLKSASVSTNNGTVTMTEAGANADEMWYSHYKDNGGNTINDNIQVNLPSNLSGVHAVEMGAVVVRNGYKDELELQFKANGNGTDEMSYFSNDPKLGPHGGWVAAGTVPALQGGENSVDFSGQILNNGSDLQFDNISVNGQSVATPAEFQAGSASGWGLAGQVDQHMQIDNNASTAPVTSEWTVSSSQTSG